MSGGVPVDDGFYRGGFIVWDSGHLTRGYELLPPDISNSSEEVIEDIRKTLTRFLGHFKFGEQLQFCWSCDSDYQDTLDAYTAETERMRGEGRLRPWCAEARRLRVQRYHDRMARRLLRRERLHLFITVNIKQFEIHHLSELTDEMVQAASLHYENQMDVLKQIMGNRCGLREMDDNDLFQAHLKFYNPSLLGVGTRRSKLKPELSVKENCVRGDIMGKNKVVGQHQYSFFSDSHYHNILSVDKWPTVATMGMINDLTRLPFLDYRVTMNLYPADTAAEIRDAEKQVDRLTNEAKTGSGGGTQAKMHLEEAQAKLRALAEGEIRPCHIEMMVQTWATDPEALSRKTAAIKGALSKMNNTSAWQPTMDSQALHMYMKTIPGMQHLNYRPYALYADSPFAATLLPFSATFTGWNQGVPEALYDGDHGNVVGMVNFYQGQPQHAALFGASGAGKSATMCDLLTQTDAYYDFTCMIEEGLSYGLLSGLLGVKPIVVTAGGEVTINYLDCYGLPVSPEQISSAKNLAAAMCGSSGIEENDNIRASMLQDFIQDLYRAHAEEWCKRNPSRQYDIARLARAVLAYRDDMMTPGSGIPDAFIEYKEKLELLKILPAQIAELDETGGPAKRLAQLKKDLAELEAVDLPKYAVASKAELTDFIKTPETEEHFYNFVYAELTPAEFPTHSDLVNHIVLQDDPVRYSQTEIQRLVSLLSVWQRGGSMGCLFDGASNVDLKARVVHFELGRISPAQQELKKMASFLILNNVRNHIMSMPRSKRKRLIFEEAGRFAQIPGGDMLIAEAYEQMRKNSCWVISIVQQYAKFQASPKIRNAVLGNSLQFILLKQTDRNDVSNLCAIEKEGLNIPQVMQDRILDFPLPSQLKKGQAYASFCYFHQAAGVPVLGVVRNYCDNQMLYVSASSSNDFEKRYRELAAGRDRSEAAMVGRLAVLAEAEYGNKDKQEVNA